MIEWITLDKNWVLNEDNGICNKYAHLLQIKNTANYMPKNEKKEEIEKKNFCHTGRQGREYWKESENICARICVLDIVWLHQTMSNFITIYLTVIKLKKFKKRIAKEFVWFMI